MSQPPKKRVGRPLLGSERRSRIQFAVSREDEAWLLTLPNRSEWLRGKIEADRKTHESENDNDNNNHDLH